MRGHHLLVERDGRTVTADLRSRSLAELAMLVGVDLDAPFAVGHDTPELGDVAAPLGVDVAHAASIGRWFATGAVALDAVLVAAADPSVVQLWPEHFDLAADVATRAGRVNLGVSPGDAERPGPYAYIGPWDPAARPGSDGFWNAPFGAARDGEVSADAVAAFFAEGLRRLDG